MSAEIMKWLQGLGAGALLMLSDYLQHVPQASWWQVAIVAVLVRLLGYVISKVGPATA